MAEVIDNRAKWDRILRELAKLRGTTVTVGVHETQSVRNGDALTNPQLAAIHEFGSEPNRIPKRSFLRDTVDRDNSIMEFAREQASTVSTGERTARIAGERVGVMVTAAVKKRIRSNIPPPLASVTVERKLAKGSHGGGLASMASNPAAALIDTGQLINSITYQVKQ